MAKRTVIQDTADIVITDLVTGKVLVTAEAQLAGIESSISTEDLFGGIGNKRLFQIRSQKLLDLTIRSAFFDNEYLAMNQGVSVSASGTLEITKTERQTVITDTGLKVNVAGTPIGGKVRIIAKDGTQAGDVAVTTGKATLPAGVNAVAGDIVTVVYRQSVTGNKIVLDATKFPNKYRVEYRTIAYDVETAAIYSDIYFVFHNAVPSGEFSMQLENGAAYAPEITFSVTAPNGSDVMGEFIEVPRV